MSSQIHKSNIKTLRILFTDRRREFVSAFLAVKNGPLDEWHENVEREQIAKAELSAVHRFLKDYERLTGWHVLPETRADRRREGREILP